MSLSSDLISQFVKITNDNDETKNETTTYGTISKDGNSTYVKLDGADTITPVVTTVNADDGDRVVVMIKNHTAYVTGNMSSPAARSGDIIDYGGRITELGIAIADKVDTKVLETERARIDSLVANDVVVKDRLTAGEAKIGVLEADNVTIHDTLTAHKASIDGLEAKTADIEVLRADVANIDTLIFGSASGNVIQTSFSNAVIAQLGNAQIKSAMIEHVSANKITSGDIVTNNVRVKSQNGLLLISDETIQINDGTRARVQIGKDASNDYSINIWDASGNLMFSKGGITDSAIKNAIIRNDMVSDTANIAAHKLDIDSLFEEINDSTNTIKSTKVYLDDKKQTLDVAFTTLSSTVDSQGETITSQGTAITTIQSQISSKIWQQDIDTATGAMSTQYSTLSQEVDSFKTTVGETYATISDVKGIEIGGRNFIIGSRDLNGTYATNYNGKTVLDNGFTAFKCTGDWHGVSYDAKNLILDSKTGDSFTYSVNIKTSDTCKLDFFAMCDTADGTRVYPDYETGQFNSASIITTNAEEEQDQRVYITFSVTQGWIDLINDGGTIKWTLQVYDGVSSDNPAYIYAPKLERGNKATDWTPAPEDVENQIAANRTFIEQTATDLTIQIESSAKTATNYLNFSGSGLVIGDMTASTLGKNILIDSDSVDIRSGTDIRASFGEDYLYLAKHSRNAKIDLCNGLATLYHQSKYSYDTLFVIDTPNATEIMGTYNPLYVTSTVTGKVAIQFSNKNGRLGSIGMVESGTESYITRNHPSTTATYSILDTGNYYKLMDSGWLTCAINTSGEFTVYSDSDNIRYRKIGKMVEVVGAVKPKKALEGGTTNYIFATLPSGYRPSHAFAERCQGSGGYSWLFSITTGGDLRYSRYSNGSSCVDLPASTWLPFHTTFFTD